MNGECGRCDQSHPEAEDGVLDDPGETTASHSAGSRRNCGLAERRESSPAYVERCDVRPRRQQRPRPCRSRRGGQSGNAWTPYSHRTTRADQRNRTTGSPTDMVRSERVAVAMRGPTARAQSRIWIPMRCGVCCLGSESIALLMCAVPHAARGRQRCRTVLQLLSAIAAQPGWRASVSRSRVKQRCWPTCRTGSGVVETTPQVDEHAHRHVVVDADGGFSTPGIGPEARAGMPAYASIGGRVGASAEQRGSEARKDGPQVLERDVAGDRE